MKIDKIKIEKIKTWNKHKQKKNAKTIKKRNGNKWNKEREIQWNNFKRKKNCKNEESK
jgi:uncharacterized protein YjaG (DUF416 family)